LTSDGIPAHHKPKIETKLDSIPAEQSIEIARIASERSTEKLAVLGDEFQKKALNACLLVACFGFVTYLVLNVDNGMTRGWTMSEKAMRIPLDNWSSYESSLNEQPIFTKTMINVVIYLLGDWLSQTVFVKKNILDFDAGRTFRNGFIGMVFGPLVHEYYEFSDHILPVDQVVNRFYKILMDQTLYISIKCSIYIIAVNMLAGESWEYSTNMVKEKLKGIMFTAWKFWPLVHCVTYGAIPAQHRILWVNCVDLFWNAILALKTSTDDDEEDIEVSSKPHGRLESLSSDFNLDVNAQGEDILKLSTHSDIVEKDCSEEVISSTSIKVSMENSILASVEEADKTGQPSGLGSDHLETPDQPSLVSNSTETKVIECS
jgi:protein Mpv17